MRVTAHTTGGDGPWAVHYTRVRGRGERRPGMRPPPVGLEVQSPVSDAFLRAGKHASIPPPNPLAFPNFPAPAAGAP